MSLSNEVRNAINAGLRDGCKMGKGDSTWEVDALVGLFRTGLPALDTALRTRLPGFNTRVGGVFCHGRPKVTITEGEVNGTSCEIGDLLVITRYVNGSVVAHRTLLLQTKCRATPDYPGVNESAYKQLVFYTTWPRFTFFSGLGVLPTDLVNT